jgi:hypothetical protein
VSIDINDLQQEFCKVPSDLAYWGERMADTHQAAKVARLRREQVESRLYTQYKAEIEAEGKRATEAAVHAALVQDDLYEHAKLTEIEAEAAALSMKNRFWAVSAKKDLVQSLGATIRAEMQRDPMVRVPTGSGSSNAKFTTEDF